MRDSFVFYRSFYEAIKDLPRKIQGEVYAAIMEYSLNDAEVENLTPIARSVFILAKPQIDKNNKRFENGCKGGRGKRGEKNQTETKSEPIANQTKTKSEPNVNDNVNVNVNDNTSPISPDGDISPPQKNDEDILFENFRKWLDKNASNVQKMKEPFTKEQYLRIRKEYDKDTLAGTILQMHNWKELTKKNVSANLTFRNWVARDRK